MDHLDPFKVMFKGRPISAKMNTRVAAVSSSSCRYVGLLHRFFLIKWCRDFFPKIKSQHYFLSSFSSPKVVGKWCCVTSKAGSDKALNL